MKDLYISHIDEAVNFIKSQINTFEPVVAITLGSGLGKLAQLIQPVSEIPYSSIPHFPVPTVEGHEGTMILGLLENVPVLGFKGRKHYYEVARDPNGMDQVIFPVHVAASLGCNLYIATNAAGGLNSSFKLGDLMVIRSHIDLFMENPLLGPHHDFGDNPFFQPQNNIYDPDLSNLFKSDTPHIHQGVYACLSGKTYESSADSNVLRTLGADAVGMSTVPEIIIAANRGMKTMGISTITNVIAADGTNATNHQEVVSILNSHATETKLLSAYQTFFKKLNDSSAIPKLKQ